MSFIKVLGLTSSSEFYIGSKDRTFRINEYLIVEDKNQGDLVFEVMEANTYNRYIPLNIGGDFIDSEVLSSLEAIGYIVDDETVYIGNCRWMKEANYPVETGSRVREPEFDEIKKFLLNGNLDDSLLIGGVKNTDKVFKDMDNNLKGLYHVLDEELSSQRDVPFLFNINEMNQYPHIGVFGGSGSGKSYGLRVFVEELMKKEIPTIIFDPHYEMEFEKNFDNPSSKTGYKEKYRSFRIGRDIGINFKDIRSGDLKKLLSSTSDLTEAMESTVDVLFSEFGYGKKSVDVRTFELFIEDLIEVKNLGTREKIFNYMMDSEGEEKLKYSRLLDYYDKYDKQTNDKTLRGLAWRIRSLINDGIFSNDSKPVEETLFSNKTAVIQGSTKLLQVYGSYLMNKLYNARRNYKDNGMAYFPPFIIITDEAHEFAPKGISKPSKQIIKEIAQEGRKYGAFLVLATQRPTLLDETVTAQLNSKFIFRTVRGTDIQTIREETDISSEEAKRLPYLKTGDFFASIASMGRTVFSRIRFAETLKPDMENPFDELRTNSKKSDEKFFKLIKNEFPISDSEVLSIIKLLEKEGEKYSPKQIKDKLDKLVQDNIIEKKEGLFGNEYTLKEQGEINEF